MSHAATCRVALRKVEAASTFSATCNAMFRAWNLQCNAIALQVAKDICISHESKYLKNDVEYERTSN